MSMEYWLSRLSPCRLLTRKLRTKIVDLKDEKAKLSNRAREKQATIDKLQRKLRRFERQKDG